MNEKLPIIREAKGKVLLQVQVKPGARNNVIIGVRDNKLLIEVTATPIGGKANAAVIALLAKSLHLPKSTFALHSGAKSRHKWMEVRGIDSRQMLQLLENFLEH